MGKCYVSRFPCADTPLEVERCAASIAKMEADGRPVELIEDDTPVGLFDNCPGGVDQCRKSEAGGSL